MNERIKELMPKPWTFPYPDRELYTKEQLEKFAELIIEECARVARATPCPYTDETMKQQLGHTWDMAASEAGREIVKHFRVEEKSTCTHDWYSAKNPVVQNGSVCVICGAIDPREPEELRNDSMV